MAYSSLMLTYYVMVQQFIAQYAAYVTIDLIFSIAAFIILVMAVYFFVALCVSFEARAERALSKLNRFFYRYPIMKNNSLPILNNIIKHSPKEFGYKWNDYLEHKDYAPSIYMNSDGCINIATRFNKASYFTKIITSFTIFAAVIMLLVGLSTADPAATFTATLYSLLLAPILIGILGGIFAAIVNVKGTETYKNMLGDFSMFQRNIDHAASGMAGVDENVVATLLSSNREKKHIRKYEIQNDKEEYALEPQVKHSSHNKPEKVNQSGVDEDFLNKLRNTPTKHKEEGVPPANFNLGGEVKPLAASTNLTANQQSNLKTNKEIKTPNIITAQSAPVIKPESIYVPENNIVKDESDQLIKQYAEEKKRILAEIAKIKEETASYKAQNQQINSVPVGNSQKAFKDLLTTKEMPKEKPEFTEKVTEQTSEAVEEPVASIVYTEEENAPETTESDLSVPKKRGRKPKAKPEGEIDLSSTLDQLASAMENLKKK